MLTASLETVLFAAGKPMGLSALRQLLETSDEVLREAVEDVKSRFNTEASGIHLIEHEGNVQFVTNPSQAVVAAKLLKEEVAGELTRPSVETLTIIAYRGPITKPEIEQIRGVNCTLIIRNLLLRGLIDEADDAKRLQPVYTVAPDFVRHLGIHSVSELPDYDELHAEEKITALTESASILPSLDHSITPSL